MVLSTIKKEAGVYCCVARCKEKPQPKKGGLCHKHYKRKLRENDPVMVRYMDLNQSCKVRGYEVHFTLPEFRLWCLQNGYLRKGRRGYSATLDRRCNLHGYHLWNMQILSNRANARKGARFSGSIFTREHHFGTSPDNWEAAGDDLPF